jgi:hypothetical protein
MGGALAERVATPGAMLSRRGGRSTTTELTARSFPEPMLNAVRVAEMKPIQSPPPGDSPTRTT